MATIFTRCQLNRIVFAVLLLTVIGIARPCPAALGDFRARTYTSTTGFKLPYRLFVPLHYDPAQEYPLIVMLHGAGESGTDNVAPARHVSATRIVDKAKTTQYSSFVLVPQTNSGWSNFSGTDPSLALQATLDVITHLEQEYSIDDSRLYLTGLSMGGYGTWDLIAKHPDLFAAAVPVAGGGDVSKASLLTDIPIWAFHGAVDSIVPTAYTRNMINAIREAGGDPLYSELGSYGHDDTTWSRVYGDPRLYQWLFAQTLPEPGIASYALIVGILLSRRRK